MTENEFLTELRQHRPQLDWKLQPHGPFAVAAAATVGLYTVWATYGMSLDSKGRPVECWYVSIKLWNPDSQNDEQASPPIKEARAVERFTSRTLPDAWSRAILPLEQLLDNIRQPLPSNDGGGLPEDYPCDGDVETRVRWLVDHGYQQTSGRHCELGRLPPGEDGVAAMRRVDPGFHQQHVEGACATHYRRCWADREGLRVQVDVETMIAFRRAGGGTA